MKKLLFACMCAATFGAFAGTQSDDTQSAVPLNSVGFEGITAGTGGLGHIADDGSDGSTGSKIYFMYEAADGSTDSSMVKAYGAGDNLPAFTYPTYPGVPDFFQKDTANNNYLELSTEGGTLWRSATETSTIEGENGTERLLGDGITMQKDDYTDYTTIYVDTMVQFTPTEDGETPKVTDEDKLAIWLNVDSSNEESPVTNLCVYANRMVGDNFDATEPTKFTVNNFNAQPGVWYRLTVKAMADVLGGMRFPGFLIYIDGKLLTTDTPTADPDAVDEWDDWMTAGVENMKKGSVFISLRDEDLGNFNAAPLLRGVGFKGSGAIDSFQIDTDAPGFFTAVGTLDFTLTWGEGISAVSYTINGGEATSATSGTKVQDVAANAQVTVSVTYAPWYEADGENSDSATFTVTEANKSYTYAAKLIESPLAGVTTDAAKAWAEAKGLTPALIADCEYAMDAYLLNTGLDAAPALAITSIEEVADGWQITVKATAGDATVSLDGINGVLKVKTAATLGALSDATADTYTATFDADGVATIKVTGDNKNFMKATVVAQ